MTSPDQEPVSMETYLEALQHSRVSVGFDVELSPTFGYVSNIEKAEHARRSYEHKMGIKFSTYRQSKDYGKQDILVDHHKVCWEDSSRLRQGHLVFDHVPYIVIGIKMLDCQYGKDRHDARKKRALNQSASTDSQTKRKHVTGKKFDCPAQIYLRDIMKFPEYAIDCNTVWRRKTMSEKLRKSLISRSEVKRERRIYIKFPDASEHNGHEINSNLAAEESHPGSENFPIREAADLPHATSERRTDSLYDKGHRNEELEVQSSRRNPGFIEQYQGNQIYSESAIETVTRQSPDRLRHIVEAKQIIDDSNQTLVITSKTIDIPDQSTDDPNQALQCRTWRVANPLDVQSSEELSQVNHSRSKLTETTAANQTVDDMNQTLHSGTQITNISVTHQSQNLHSGTQITNIRGTDQSQTLHSGTQKTNITVADQCCADSDKADKCRRLLERLIEETFCIQDPSILDTLHSQLQDVARTVQRAKYKGDEIPSSQPCTDTVKAVPQRPMCSSSLSGTNTMTTLSQIQTSKQPPREALPSVSPKHPDNRFPKRSKRRCTCKERSCKICSRAKRVQVTEVIHDELSSDHSVSSQTMKEAQALILDKFPLLHGFEDTTLGHHLLFSAAQGEFGQLMHDGKDRWVLVTSISCPPGTVKYYDSMGGGTIPDSIRKQIACIVCSHETQILVEIQPVQLSKDVTDCGLLAIAFAIGVLHSEDPALVCYDVSSLRHHLHHCFQERCLTPFPKVNQTMERTVKRLISVDVFCLCRMPWNVIAEESKMKMAQCITCGEWWHSNCCGIPDAANRHKWKCPRCEDVHSAVTALDSLQSAVFPNEET